MVPTWRFLLIGLMTLFPISALAQLPEGTVEDLMNLKCSLCHDAHRYVYVDPAQVKPLIDRMVSKNPDWFKDTKREHLVAAILTLLKDPAVEARRKAWLEIVAKGKALFSDPSLGRSGESCSSCHTTQTLRIHADTFPRYDQTLGRFLTAQETINLMIIGKMEGEALPLGDPRVVALEAYLKTFM
jgi:thiosulfate dehydrogenase